jgi:glycosyltransferase involved in cell wall biosynthesis
VSVATYKRPAVPTAGLPASFEILTSKKKLREDLNLPQQDPIFIVVARLSAEKNIQFILQAFSSWRKKYAQGKLVIIGDGNEKAQLERLSRTLRIARHVRFLGKVQNQLLIPWLNASDVFLYSSITDTISVNLVEAMSAGLPIVALDDKTTRELVIPGINGLLSRPDISEFVSHMHTALSRNSELSAGAKKHIKMYTLHSTSTALIESYEKIITNYKKQTH